MTFSEKIDKLCKNPTGRVILAGVASGVMTFTIVFLCVVFYQLYTGTGFLQSIFLAICYGASAGWILMFAGFIIKDYDEAMSHRQHDSPQ